LVRLLLLAALAIAAVLAAGGAWAWLAIHARHAGWEGEAAHVVVEPGVDAGTILQHLSDVGVIRHPRLARAWLALGGGDGAMQAGEYRFDRPLSDAEVLARLGRGEVLLHRVTLPEGLSFVEIAGRLDAAGFGPRTELLARFEDPSRISDLDPEASDLEGYLFPDTYHFPRDAPPDLVVDSLVRRFREATGEEFVEAAAASGLGLRGAVILASMIEKETSVPRERERISQVFHNRLKRGMRLECDPTVLYALRRAGHAVNRLSYDDLKFDSPWNTYVVQGLPAGPIANPGRESLLASLNPSEGRELYFVAAPGGGHRFSESLAAHLEAVAEWRRYSRSSR
jgi:UPF0755 protein